MALDKIRADLEILEVALRQKGGDWFYDEVVMVRETLAELGQIQQRIESENDWVEISLMLLEEKPNGYLFSSDFSHGIISKKNAKRLRDGSWKIRRQSLLQSQLMDAAT